MAITEISNPTKTVGLYTSFSASTTQLLYEVQEDAIAGKENYLLRVNVTVASDTTAFYYTADSTGLIKFNLGKAVDRLISSAAQLYSIEMQAFADGYTSNIINTSPDIFAIVSDRQIMESANMLEFTINSEQPGKFMSVFNEPVIWEGWPNYAYIISQSTTAIDVDIEYLDVNKQLLLSGPYTNTTTVPTIVGTPLALWDTVPPPAGTKYASAQWATGLSQKVFHRVEPECRNPIMIQWLNSNGVYDQWLFQYEQGVTNITDEGYTYERPINQDIETVTGNKYRETAKDVQFMTLKADQLSQNELQGLHDIKRSNDVRVVDKSENYVSVIVNAAYETTFTTGKSNYEFTLNIEFPNNFDYFKWQG